MVYVCPFHYFMTRKDRRSLKKKMLDIERESGRAEWRKKVCMADDEKEGKRDKKKNPRKH